LALATGVGIDGQSWAKVAFGEWGLLALDILRRHPLLSGSTSRAQQHRS